MESKLKDDDPSNTYDRSSNHPGYYAFPTRHQYPRPQSLYAIKNIATRLILNSVQRNEINGDVRLELPPRVDLRGAQ